jgi:hypothetical protein
VNELLSLPLACDYRRSMTKLQRPVRFPDNGIGLCLVLFLFLSTLGWCQEATLDQARDQIQAYMAEIKARQQALDETYGYGKAAQTTVRQAMLDNGVGRSLQHVSSWADNNVYVRWSHANRDLYTSHLDRLRESLRAVVAADGATRDDMEYLARGMQGWRNLDREVTAGLVERTGCLGRQARIMDLQLEAMARRDDSGAATELARLSALRYQQESTDRALGILQKTPAFSALNAESRVPTPIASEPDSTVINISDERQQYDFDDLTLEERRSQGWRRYRDRWVKWIVGGVSRDDPTKDATYQERMKTAQDEALDALAQKAGQVPVVGTVRKAIEEGITGDAREVWVTFLLVDHEGRTLCERAFHLNESDAVAFGSKKELGARNRVLRSKITQMGRAMADGWIPEKEKTPANLSKSMTPVKTPKAAAKDPDGGTL